MKNLSLYIHIPFCVQKCHYCDFLSAPEPIQVQEQYLNALLKEIQRVSPDYNSFQIKSIFIGGGTPSIYKPQWIQLILQTIKQNFQFQKDAEVTMEMNPGTVKELEAFIQLRNGGINRLSLGLQSVKDEELRALGRIHTFSEFLHAYELAGRAGFENINVDLMSALPGQSLESYKESLHRVCNLKPAHISAYSLIIEEGTPFFERINTQKEDMNLPSEELERQMYQITKEILHSYGYERYEISNYAQEGKECRHNLVYWTRGDYLGLGIGAASMIHNKRFKNTSILNSYITKQGNVPYEEIEILSKEEQMSEFMILGLRLIRGIQRGEFQTLFGQDPESVYPDVIKKNEKDGLLVIDNERIYLSKRGIDLSNYVMAQFL